MFPIQIARLVEICHRKGVRQVVVSPGSRSAPLTIGFVRHGGFTVRTISDERSAAYVALGIAQATGQVVALVATSGTAAINHAPAVAEAFYLQIPLLVLSADRPPEWIDQQDGQTVRQTALHQGHTKMSAQLPIDTHPDSLWHADRLVNELLNEALTYPCAPVHLNVPIREPFYPKPTERIDFQSASPFPVKIVDEEKSQPHLTERQWQQLAAQWEQYPKKLVLVGQNWHAEWTTHLAGLDVPVVADVIGNYTGTNAINHHELFEFHEGLQPDLLVTAGLSVLSKKLKLFLRKFRPQAHWHIAPSGKVADTFQSLTNVIRLVPTDFFSEAARRNFQTTTAFYQEWMQAEQAAIEKIQTWQQKCPLGELSVVAYLLDNLPDGVQLHLANSMAVRYVNVLGLPKDRRVRVFSNRGTSGIDGSSSTAVGHALAAPDKLHILVTGDMAFFYDRNAFWHNYPLPNLKVLLLNNHAGIIFRLIDAANQPELEEYFETHQALQATLSAEELGFRYWKVTNSMQFHEAFGAWLAEKEKPALFELISTKQESVQLYHSLLKG